MAPSDNGQESQRSLDTLRIDPEAESRSSVVSPVSAKQENAFFERGAAEYQLAQNRLNLGWLGKFFGANSEAPTNIAGFVAVIALAVLVGSMFCQPSDEISDLRKALLGLISTALAFIFGAASKK